MKKGFTLLALLLVAVLAFAACGSSNDDTQPSPTPGAADASPTPTPSPAPDTGNGNGGDGPEGLTVAPDFEEDREGFLDFHFPGTDLGGVTLRVQGFEDPFQDNVYYAHRGQAAIDRIERKFNVTLDLTNNYLPGVVDWAEIPNFLIASVAAGDPAVHLFSRANAGAWFTPLARQGALIEMGNWPLNNLPPTFVHNAGMYQGRVYGFSHRADYSWDTWGYNRELIRRIGMPMTPSEMFIAGRWSYDDFYDYLSEMATLMGPGQYPIHLRNLGFGYTRNSAAIWGTTLLDPVTNVPRFLDEGFFEPIRLIQRLISSNIHPQASWNEDMEFWSFGIPTPPWDAFRDGNIGITSLAPWDFPAPDFEFGIVPMPWPNHLNFPASGDWRDMRIANPGMYRPSSHDNSANYLLVGTPSVVTPEVYLNILMNAFPWYAPRLLNSLDHWNTYGVESPTGGWWEYLWTDQDIELYQWWVSDPIFDTSAMIGGVMTWDIQIGILESMSTGADPRPMFEAQLGEITWNLLDRGAVTVADLTPEMRALAEEFGANVE
jgi:ABC-type glycerol-3-phosphate transport system substrate-binding protein